MDQTSDGIELDLHGLASCIRDTIERWLYDGDFDHPVNDGYAALHALADEVAVMERSIGYVETWKVRAELERDAARAEVARHRDAAPNPCATCGRPLLDHSPASSHCRGYVGDPVLVEAARRQVKEANDMRIAMGARIPKLTDRAVAAEAALERVKALHQEENYCTECSRDYPCATIRAVEGVLGE